MYMYLFYLLLKSDKIISHWVHSELYPPQQKSFRPGCNQKHNNNTPDKNATAGGQAKKKWFHSTLQLQIHTVPITKFYNRNGITNLKK